MKFSPMSPPEIRETWQSKALAACGGKMAAVLLSVFAHSYEAEELLFLLHATYGSTTIATPFFCSAARISRRGRIYCQMVDRDAADVRTVVVFKDESSMEREFRKLADSMKLSDPDRVDMFDTAKRWIVCDYRQDPDTGERELRIA